MELITVLLATVISLTAIQQLKALLAPEIMNMATQRQITARVVSYSMSGQTATVITVEQVGVEFTLIQMVSVLNVRHIKLCNRIILVIVQLTLILMGLSACHALMAVQLVSISSSAQPVLQLTH